MTVATGSELVRVAAVQAAPVFLDRRATTDKAVTLIGEAADQGANLIVFPEAFVPAYPEWVWRVRPWDERSTALQARLFDQSVIVGSRTTEVLAGAARERGVFVSIGVNERAERSTALFSTQLLFGPDGSLLGRHRKLMPTGAERLVWSMGDGSALEVSSTSIGRVGTLTSWENYMPLARAALFAQGVDLYLAPTWDSSDVWPATLRHVAKEGRVFVIGANSLLRGSDIPEHLPYRAELYGGEEDWLALGNSAIVGPEGDVLAGPLQREEGVVYADVDVQTARTARHQFDPFGHYARPDVVRLLVDIEPRSPVSFAGTPDD
ncbi:MAG TPA: carbon-nitrogen hydrolase family protein [Acidimicrobiales bacterium]|jgi:nitrilase|nr:carbon-nitrogen hydrolase family protein [Acidimicrobiales bacterium]